METIDSSLVAFVFLTDLSTHSTVLFTFDSRSMSIPLKCFVLRLSDSLKKYRIYTNRKEIFTNQQLCNSKRATVILKCVRRHSYVA